VRNIVLNNNTSLNDLNNALIYLKKQTSEIKSYILPTITVRNTSGYAKKVKKDMMEVTNYVDTSIALAESVYDVAVQQGEYNF